jgi:hypothetical protein
VNPNGNMLELKEFLFSKEFHLGEKCTYIQWNKSAGSIADLRPGEKVTVFYQDAMGVLVADRIQQDPMTKAGTVATIDATSHLLTLRSGWVDKTFRVPDNCQIMLPGNKAGSLASLKRGYYVKVIYELPQDKLVAREITQTGTTFTGKLVAIDLNSRTLKAKSLFDTKQFNLADDCTIMINGKRNTQLSDLKLGEEFRFSYDDVIGIYVVNSIASESVSKETETTSTQPMSSFPYP